MKLKKLLASILALCMVLSTMGTVAFAEDVEQTVFEIASVGDFIKFAKATQDGDSFSGKTVILTADIDFDGANFLEIDEDGTIVTDYRIPRFNGTFDGDGHTIKNFNFDVKGGKEQNIMMFSSDNMWAYIKDLNIENVNVNIADISDQTRVTALANLINAGGMTDAAIKNVHVKNFKITSENITSDDFRIGGLAYFTQGSQLVMQDCSITGFEVDVNKAALIGGAVAVIKSNCDFVNVDVNDATFDVALDSTSAVAGGFVAQTQSGGSHASFTDCDVTNLQMNLGSIKNNIGGFVGSIGAVSQFYSCSVTGSIDVDTEADGSSVGGFAGDLGWNGMSTHNIQHEFNNCVADVDITAVNANVGGFIGNCTVAGDQALFMPAYFTGCEAMGDVKTENGVAGGFVGRGDRGLFTECSASGDVEGRIAGGFWGELYSKTEAEYKGSFGMDKKEVTHTDENSKSIVLEKIYVNGTATGTEYDAGLIGYMENIFVNEDGTHGYKTPIILNGNSTDDYNQRSYDAATVNGTSYATLQNAVDAANGETVTLLRDIEENITLGDVSGVSVIADGDPVVIDLNGFTVTPEDETLPTFINGGNYIIKNGIVVGDINNNGSALEIQDVTVEGNVVVNAGSVNITDGVFEGEITVADEADLVVYGGKFAKVLDAKYLATDLIWAVGEHGYMVPVTNAGLTLPVSDKVTVKLEQDKDNPNMIDVILVADENTEIHRFLSAELNITLTADANDITPISIKNIVGNEYYGIEVIKPQYNANEIWGFHLGEATDITVKDFSGSELTIATIELTGYGAGNLTVAAHDNNKVQAIQSKDNNNVKFYTVDADTLVLPKEVTPVNLEVPTKDLTIEITFVNPIEDNDVAYQDMTVTVEGKDIDTKTIELGKDGDFKLVKSEDGKIVQYIILVEDCLTENNSYNITVTGAGYRTADYRVTMTDNKTVYFWNNAAMTDKEIEIGVSKPVIATFLAGDIAEDNIIDKYDLAAVVSYFGKYNLNLANAEGVYEYAKYAKYDLNRDGNIDSEDIAYVLASFGK